jgi:hypothetical protein
MPVPFPASRSPPLVSINERDLDFMLLTAIHGSAAFRAALVKKLSGMVIAEFVGARRAVYGQEGETDLLVEIRTESGERVAIAIQVKIDSSFQPKQSERCRLRGEKGKALGQWDRFVTCLCAPRRYASLYVRIGDWDHVLFLEDAAEDLAIHDEPFASFLGAAMRQTAEEYERDGHAAGLKATAFWMRYADLCRQEFPDLAMSRMPPVSSSNDLRPRFLATILPAEVRLEHKAWNGFVDLAFQNRDMRELVQKLGDLLPHGMNISSVRRSAILRTAAPRLDAVDPFELQIAAVRAGLETARRLAEFWPIVHGRMGYDPEPATMPERSDA